MREQRTEIFKGSQGAIQKIKTSLPNEYQVKGDISPSKQASKNQSIEVKIKEISLKDSSKYNKMVSLSVTSFC